MTLFNLKDKFTITGTEIAMLLQAFNQADDVFKSVEGNDDPTYFPEEREIIENVLRRKQPCA